MLLASDGQVKIADFGIAHVAGHSPDTGPVILLGTPAYLAPELVAGSPPTPASDMYALGIVAYECLTGSPPFAGTPSEVAQAHRDLPMPSLPASVPSEVAALVAELTAKDDAGLPARASDIARRAGYLRDHLSDVTTAPQRSWLSRIPDATLTDLPLHLRAGSERPQRFRLSRRVAVIGGFATVAIAVLGLVAGHGPDLSFPSCARGYAGGPPGVRRQDGRGQRWRS